MGSPRVHTGAMGFWRWFMGCAWVVHGSVAHGYSHPGPGPSLQCGGLHTGSPGVRQSMWLFVYGITSRVQTVSLFSVARYEFTSSPELTTQQIFSRSHENSFSVRWTASTAGNRSRSLAPLSELKTHQNGTTSTITGIITAMLATSRASVLPGYIVASQRHLHLPGELCL